MHYLKPKFVFFLFGGQFRKGPILRRNCPRYLFLTLLPHGGTSRCIYRLSKIGDVIYTCTHATVRCAIITARKENVLPMDGGGNTPDTYDIVKIKS